MVSIKIDIKKKDFVWIVPVILILVIGVAYAMNSGNPNIMGHSLDEILLPVCTDGQVLGMSGGSWSCSDISVGSGGSIVLDYISIAVNYRDDSGPVGIASVSCPTGYEMKPYTCKVTSMDLKSGGILLDWSDNACTVTETPGSNCDGNFCDGFVLAGCAFNDTSGGGTARGTWIARY